MIQQRCAKIPGTVIPFTENVLGKPSPLLRVRNRYCPNLEVFDVWRAELQLGHSVRAWLGASAPEASGVKTPDQTQPFVGTKVPTSYRIARWQL